MITHHPSDELLMEYAAGTTAEPVALVLAAHLSLCGTCRRELARLEELGAAFLDLAPPAPLDDGALAAVLDAIEAGAGASEDESRRASADGATLDDETRRLLPRPVWPYLNGSLADLPWRGLGRSVRTLPIVATRRGPHKKARASLLRLAPGAMVPAHTHRGSEYTLVLDGHIEDGAEKFVRGDLAVLDETTHHTPKAGADRECLCLTVLDAPLRFGNPFVELLYRALPGARL